MNNLHITLTEVRNESRLLKEAGSIKQHGIVDSVFIAALYGQGLPQHEAIADGISVKRFVLFSRRLPRNLVVQVVKYIEFMIRVAGYYRKKDIGLVNIHALALLPLGFLLKSVYGARLIYDTHELESETNGLTGLRKKLAKRVEHSFIDTADQVFVVSEAIAEQYVLDYHIKRPVVVLNTPQYRSVSPTNRFRETFAIGEDRAIFLYQGALVSGRGVEVVLEAFKSNIESSAVIVFMGYGPLEAEIKAASMNYPHIFFHPAVRPQAVLDYTASADIGIALIENTCLSYYYCMPNKLFEYLMAGLPVIVSNMREMAAFVRDNTLGVVTADETPAAISSAIATLLKADLNHLRENALAAGKRYSWELQEQKMIAAYQTLTG